MVADGGEGNDGRKRNRGDGGGGTNSDAGEPRDEHAGERGGELVGLSVDEAVRVALERGRSGDETAVRAALRRVAEDGRLTETGVRNALAHLSKVVATPETRLEVAERALASARTSAEPVSGLDVVDRRLRAFESRRDRLSAQVDELGDSLQQLLEAADGPASTLEVARGVRRLTGVANGAQRDADELLADVEAFERWVETPSLRYDEVAEDADALEAAAAALVSVVESLETAADRSTTDGAEPAGSPAAEADDPAAAWLAATVRRRVLGLLIADVRAECRTLRTWADREDDAGGDAGSPVDEVEAQLDEVETRRRECGRRLDALGRPEGADRFGGRVAAIEDDLDEMEPPVDWDAVTAAVESRLPESVLDD